MHARCLRRFTLAVLALLLCCGLVAGPAGAQSPGGAPTLDALLDGSAVNEIWLRINAKDWEQLHTDYREGRYYPVDFEWQGVRARNAGVRTRGRTSRNDRKPSLRVDFNRYVTGQEFLGVKALVLNSLWMDPSMLRDRLSMTLFRKMGIPAPRQAHVRVYVGANREFVGVYAVVEEINSSFLTAKFGENAGYLYEYHTQDAYGFQDPGPDLEWYRPRFDPQTHEHASTADLYMPLRNLVEAVNDARPADLQSALGEYLDVDTFITEIAIQNFVAQTDGLLGDFGMANFYLYRFDQKRLAQLIPWDQDGSFRVPDMPPWHNMDTNVLAAKIWREPKYRERYLRTLLEVADLVSTPANAPTVDDPSTRTCPAAADAQPCSWLEGEVFLEYAQIRDSVYADPLMPYPTAEFDQDVAAIQRFARDRADIIRRYVAQVAPDLRATGAPFTER